MTEMLQRSIPISMLRQCPFCQFHKLLKVSLLNILHIHYSIDIEIKIEKPSKTGTNNVSLIFDVAETC